jgi:Ca-activated chloride channel homolog
MTFQWPLALLSLLLVPAAVGGYVLFQRRRGDTAARFATPSLFPNVVDRQPGRLRHLPAAILLVGLTLMLMGLARPHATISVPREEATIVLAMDVSRSMGARDVFPSRLVAARAAARRFLEKVPDSFRVAVVAFSDRAQVAAPATDDRGVTNAALSELRLGEGTALGEAIMLSLKASRPPQTPVQDAPPASILVLSDGAQTVGDVTPAAAATRARAQGVPVHTIALGTPEGIVERQLPGGFTEQVRVPPDPQTLQQIARTTGGEFFAAPDDKELTKVYDELGSRLGSRPKKAEITVAFAGASTLLLLLGGAASAVLFRRLP